MVEKAASESIDELQYGSLVVFGTILAGLLLGWKTSLATGDDALALGAAVLGMAVAFLAHSYVTYGR
ncbi:MAG: hypothetical protein ACLFMX_06350 [Halobacteriales archaeon]